MFGAGDEGLDRLRGEVGVDLIPCGIGVLGHFAVYDNLGAQSLVPIGRGELKSFAVDVGGENDTVIADAHFDDVSHAVFGTGRHFGFFDLARGVGHVDGVLAHAFAETFEASRGTARFHDRCREVEVLAKGFGDDGGIWQHGRGTGNLYLVTRGSSGCEYGGNRQGGCGEFCE